MTTKHKPKLLQLALHNSQAPATLTVNMADGAASVHLKGVISADFGIGADDLRGGLEVAAGSDVLLYINSPGGDVFEGREMQAVIAAYPGKVTAVVQGLAASAATMVAMAASDTQIVKGSRYMIHNGWTLAMGDRHDMEAVRNLLAGFDAELANEYAAQTGATAAQAAAWMDAETWFTAEEAVTNGFASKVLANTQNAATQQAMQAAWNLAAYRNAPPLQDDERAAIELNESRSRVMRLNRNRLAALLTPP
jgi:ATP-dependent Clp protease, protease subunit